MEAKDKAYLIQQLSSLLSMTAVEHRQYEIDELDGQYDDEWPDWYANHLLESGLFDILKNASGDSSMEHLVALLVEADKRQQAEAPEDKWQDYYAKFLSEAYADNRQG